MERTKIVHGANARRLVQIHYVNALNQSLDYLLLSQVATAVQQFQNGNYRNGGRFGQIAKPLQRGREPTLNVYHHISVQQKHL